jgi:hypothetical protein
MCCAPRLRNGELKRDVAWKIISQPVFTFGTCGASPNNAGLPPAVDIFDDEYWLQRQRNEALKQQPRDAA